MAERDIVKRGMGVRKSASGERLNAFDRGDGLTMCDEFEYRITVWASDRLPLWVSVNQVGVKAMAKRHF